MNSGSGFLLIIGGLLLLYTVVTGKFSVLENAFYQLFEIKSDEPPSNVEKVEGGMILGIPVFNKQGEVTLPKIFIPDYTKP